jgi:hypothetical protein
VTARKQVVERYIEGFRTGDRELILGWDSGRIDAVFCDVFNFRDDKICRLVTYQVDGPGEHTRRAFER